MKKSYYSITPANVRYDEELTANAKLLYGEITALCNEKGYCWANNNYFAELYGVAKETVSRWISKLEKRGHIKTKLIFEEGTKQVKERRIYISYPIDEIVNTPRQNNQDPIDEIVNTPIDENVKDNNTYINNTSYIKDILSYLNEKTDKNYKHTSKKTQDLIKARFNEGFTVEDFYTVIDIKTAEWKDNPKYDKFLRPITLFSNKFESYLNQKVVKNNREDERGDDYYDLEKHGIGISL